MFIYASIILQTLEKSRKYLVRTTTAKSAKSAQTTQYQQISRSLSRQLSSTSSNDSGPKLRQKQKPSIERYILLLSYSTLYQSCNKLTRWVVEFLLGQMISDKLFYVLIFPNKPTK